MTPKRIDPAVQPMPFGSELAQEWQGFVNCAQRAGSMVPFLLRTLRLQSDCRVIDLAAGTGCDMIALHEHAIECVGNEIDDDLRAVAMNASASRGWHPEFGQCDWCTLSEHYGIDSFDAAFLVGNSFCLLTDHEARTRAAEEIRRLLRPGGRFVIDERNFSYIRTNRDQILSGHFRYRYRAVYCGKAIKGRPIVITREQVVFAYVEQASGREIGRLAMYPFDGDEMKSLFESVGFRHVETTGDCGLSTAEDADFVMHVFEAV